MGIFDPEANIVYKTSLVGLRRSFAILMIKPSDFPLLFLILTAALQGPKNARGQSSQEFDWRQDWAVEEGFNLSIDSDGFYLPTALAFVLLIAQGHE